MIQKKKLWEYIKTILINDNAIDSDIYNNYFRYSKIAFLDNSNCEIIVKNKFSKSIMEKYLYKIEKIIKEKTNKDILCSILYNEKNKNKKISLSNNNNKYSFFNFVLGDFNNHAYYASLSVIEELGKKWNPLFIYSNPGLGKTHLLNAIKEKIIKKYNKKISFMNSVDFGKLIIDVIKKGNNEIEKLKNSILDNDVLLIDDIQFLGNRNKTNEILFDILNIFIENNKQIIITSDISPEKLNGFEKRLTSRFQSGLSVSIDIPKYESVYNIINSIKKNNNLSFELSDDIYKLIIDEKINSDIRKIKGFINKLVFYLIINNINKNYFFTIEDINKILNKNKNEKNKKRLNVKRIKKEVCKYYKISILDIESNSRIKNVLYARKICIFLIKDILDLSFKNIADIFNKKDHTSAMYNYNQIKKQINTNEIIKNDLKKIKSKIL